MTLSLVEIFFSLILLLLWFTLVNLRERYLELDLKGWGEMSLGVFLIFLGSLLELSGNFPDLRKYLYVGDMPWGEFSKISLYLVGVFLVCISPINWLPSLLESRLRLSRTDKKSIEVSSFLSELSRTVNQAHTRETLGQMFDSALAYICAGLKADAGALFLFPDESKKELTLSNFQGLSPETVDNFVQTESSGLEIFARAFIGKKIETSGEILNSDRRLALAAKEQSFESCICIPLLSQGEDSGMLVFFSKNKYYFEVFPEAELLQMSVVLADKIQQGRKTESLEQKEGELKTAGERERFLRLISEDLIKKKGEETLHRIVQTGSEIFHPCACKIFLWENEAVVLRAASGPEFSEEGIYSSSNDWLKNAIKDKDLKFLTDEQYPELKQRGLKKMVVAPLEKADEFTGTMVFEYKSKEDSFSPSEIDFIRTLASQASEALGKIYIRKRLEQKENLLSSLLDSIDDRVTIHDKNQKIVRINKAGLKSLNLPEEEVLGRSCFELLYKQSQPQACPCYLTFKEKKPCFQQIKLQGENSDKEGWLKVWTQPLLDDKGEVEMVIEYARLEEAKEAVPLADAERKDIPPEFFNNLNNILAGILGNVELVMFQLKQYRDFNAGTVKDQINLIEELVIEGSNLIREVKGERPKLPEREQLPEKKIEAGEPGGKTPESLKILAIDDQKIILDLLESILQGLGHQVKVTLSGREGLELLQRDGFDLVITDLGMPDMSGWEVSQRVKQMKKDTPVVMITGWGVSFELDKIREFGVDYLLSKPFKVEQLSRLIDQIRSERSREKSE